MNRLVLKLLLKVTPILSLWLATLAYSAAAHAQLTAFPECNFSGTPVALTAGQYTGKDLRAAGIADNSLSAVVLSEGYSATLYAEDGFRGNSKIVKATRKCLDIDKFDNAVSSMTIQRIGDEEKMASAVSLARATPETHVTVYTECEYQGRAVSLDPGEYLLGSLQQAGITNNSISSIAVPRGLEVLVYANDFYRGESLQLNRSNRCLRRTGLDDEISSLVISQPRSFGNTNTNLNANVGAGGTGVPTDSVMVYSECGYRGISVALGAGEFMASDLEQAGLPNNAISSIRVPAGFEVTLYENDFFRGKQGKVRGDDDCLRDDGFNDIVSSIAVTGSAAVLPSDGTPLGAEEGATIYAKCGYKGRWAALPEGDYNAEELTRLGIGDNAISAVRVAPGYQIELFFHDFQRGKSGFLRSDDDCLANDGFDDEVSSVRVTRVEQQPQQQQQAPLTQIDGGLRAARVYGACDYRGGSVALSPGRYTQDKLRELGIGNDVVSAVQVEPGYEVILYDNGQLRGRGVSISADDNCLDNEGMLRRVSSLIIRPATQASGRRQNQAQLSANMDKALECVQLYVNRNICDAKRWTDMNKRCKLEQVPAMTDGWFQQHVNAGNCTEQYWDALSERVRNPSLR